MDKKAIDILLVEDQPADAQLVEELLTAESSARFSFSYVKWLKDAITSLGRVHPDIVLLDLSLPDACGLETVAAVQKAAPRIPIVVLSGMENEELAIQAVHRGAQDYILKGSVDGHLLLRSIRYAIERKRLTESLIEQNEQLKALDRMKSEFVSVVTHELRTPVTAIQLALKLLEDGIKTNLGVQQQEDLQMLHRNVQRLTTLINDVLDFSRIESGRLQIELRETDLCALLHEAANSLEAQARARKCTLTVKVPEETLLARCDQDKIMQVLVNLLHNAIKHNAEGVTVTVGAQREGDKIRVWVRDNGKGIAAEEHTKIFDPFYQVCGSASTGGKGTGLGLAICKGLIEGHASSLTIKSDTDQGCEFSFNLSAVPMQSWTLGKTKKWSMKHLDVTAGQYSDRVRILLSGRLESANCATLSRLCKVLLQRWGKRLILDLSGCTGMDSRGIGFLVELRAKALEMEGNVVLLNIPKKLRNILQITGILESIPDYLNLSAALEALPPAKAETGGHHA